MNYLINGYIELIELKNIPNICMSENLWLDLIKVLLYF